nr:MAG TPA: hypothetical protein [Caudoviricetes sp.]
MITFIFFSFYVLYSYYNIRKFKVLLNLYKNFIKFR